MRDASRLLKAIWIAAIAGSAFLMTAGWAAAATITVNTFGDEVGANPATCAVREAITAANTDAAFGGCPAELGA